VNYYGINTYYTDSLEIIGNTINATTGNSQADGVFLSYNLNTIVRGNSVLSSDYGVHLSNYSIPSGLTQTRNFEVVNNMIISEGDYGLYLSYVDKVDVYHNTIKVNGNSSAFRIFGSNSSPISN